MTCQEAEALIDRYVDGELDLDRSLALEAHLESCARCTAALDAARALSATVRTAPYFRAPDKLTKALRARETSAATPVRTRSVSAPWLLAAAGWIVAAIGLTLAARWRPAPTAGPFIEDLVATHARSMLADHLTDVLSSDRHTVKPWIAAHAGFSPTVLDLAADGFPLIGGRLDHVDGHDAAALVYKRREHVIDVFIWPAADPPAPPATGPDSRGFHTVHWARDGMDAWAVSDLAPEELQAFAAKLAAGG